MPVRVVIDSHVVGVAKPDPRIFDAALGHFEGIDRGRIAYVGDSVTMDIGGARAAGLHPVLLDPYDDHAGADFARVLSLDGAGPMTSGQHVSPQWASVACVDRPRRRTKSASGTRPRTARQI